MFRNIWLCFKRKKKKTPKCETIKKVLRDGVIRYSISILKSAKSRPAQNVPRTITAPQFSPKSWYTKFSACFNWHYYQLNNISLYLSHSMWNSNSNSRFIWTWHWLALPLEMKQCKFNFPNNICPIVINNYYF